MKISSLIVGIILIGLFASVFGLFFANISTNYSQDYNSTTFSSYDKVQNITTQTAEIKEGLETESTTSGVTDLIGGFLKKGFAVIRITFQSFDLLDAMTTDAVGEIDEKTGGAGVQMFSQPITAIIEIPEMWLAIC